MIVSFSLSHVYAEPTIHDDDYIVERFVTGLYFPTTMEFIGDDILVLEKNTGKVLRIQDNGVIYVEPVLDVPVDVKWESGLLGIASVSDNVYLYFTKPSSGFDEYNSDSSTNVVHKYDWNGEKLTNPVLIKELLSVTIDHHGGIITKGLNNEVYFVIGDQNKLEIFQNVPVETNYETGSIFKIDTTNNDIELFATGIRNSFGLGVDPVTGYLWDTENGPSYFDEINLVRQGFNSGWALTMGPDDRGHPLVEELRSNMDRQMIADDIRDILVQDRVSWKDNPPWAIINDDGIFKVTDEPKDAQKLGNFVYSDPEFSWHNTVGPTAITFPDQDSFRKYSDWLFVGDFHNGKIYKFQLNADRTGFVFSNPELSDLVLDNNDEMTEITFATGFQGVIDIKFHDGVMYVVVIGDGSIYKIYPKELQSSGTGVREQTMIEPSNDSLPAGIITWFNQNSFFHELCMKCHSNFCSVNSVSYIDDYVAYIWEMMYCFVQQTFLIQE